MCAFRLLLAFCLVLAFPAAAQPLPEVVEWELVGPSVPTSVDSLANTFGLAFVHDTLVASTSRADLLYYDEAAAAWAAFRVQHFPVIQGPLATATLTAAEAAAEDPPAAPGAAALFIRGASDRAGPFDTGWTRIVEGTTEHGPIRAFGGQPASGEAAGALYLGTNAFGNGSPSVLRSTDGGRTWGALSGYSGVFPYALAYAPSVPAPPAEGLPHGALVAADAFGLAYSHGAADAAADPDTAQALAWQNVSGFPFRTYAVVAVQPGPRDGGLAGRFVAASYTGSDSRLYASDDGGTTWAEIYVPSGVIGAGLRVIATPDGALYAFDQGSDRAREIYGSADGGQTWADLGRVGLGWPFGIEQLVVGPDGRLYAGGGDGVPGYNPPPGEPAGGVFRTVQPVVAVTSEPAPDAAPGFGIGPVHPNPTGGGALTVPVALSTPGGVVLTLYDVLGRRTVRYEQTYSAGRHEARLDVGALAPGLYVVRARTDDGATATTRFTVSR